MLLDSRDDSERKFVYLAPGEELSLRWSEVEYGIAWRSDPNDSLTSPVIYIDQYWVSSDGEVLGTFQLCYDPATFGQAFYSGQPGFSYLPTFPLFNPSGATP